jgi:hypothetical protein
VAPGDPGGGGRRARGEGRGGRHRDGVCDARSSRSSLEGGRRVKSGDVASDGERVKDKANADGGFLEAEERGSTWLALVRRRIFAAREK